MLELKGHCENCRKKLNKDSSETYICSYECTFCAACAEEIYFKKCPNCSGDLQKRPARSISKEIDHVIKFRLETPRLLLNSFDQSTYDAIFSGFEAPKIRQIFGHLNDEEYELECSRYKGGFSTYNLTIQFFQLVSKESNEVLGWAGYHSWAKQHHRAELFYSLKKDEFKRKGFMSEALQPILEYGKNQMDLYRIEAFVATDNIPSNRLMQKFGFQKETTLKHRYQFGDEVDTDNFYSLLPNPKYQ